MLEEAEKYARIDKEKRENIELKNQAEALCFEVENEISILEKSNVSISEVQEQKIKEMILSIRELISKEYFDGYNEKLQKSMESLKTLMTEINSTKVNTDPIDITSADENDNNLNDV